MTGVRVAITGVGMVTPLGNNAAESWQGLVAGRSAVRWLTPEDHVHGMAGNGPPGMKRWFGAPVREIQTDEPRSVQFLNSAAQEAIAQANLHAGDLTQAGLVIGASKADLNWLDEAWREPPLASSHPFAWEPCAAAHLLANRLNCQGPVLHPVAACATGLTAIIRGAELIQQGTASVVLAGSVDAALHPGLLMSYQRLGVLASPGENPARCCKPFDEHRAGFAVGEGAAVVVLEAWDHARQRGAIPLAEWIGGGLASDPTGLTTIDSNGTALAELLQRLLKRLQLSAGDLDAVNVHGTATKMNDAAEAAALSQIFNHSCVAPLGWGLKGAIGHLMGAAGSVETAAAVLALAHQQWPATVNHEHTIADCPLRFRSETNDTSLRHVLKVSLGFGGHVAAGILRRAPR